MAAIKISNLPSLAAAALTDLFVDVPIAGGTTYKGTLTQLAALFNANLAFVPTAGGTITGAIINYTNTPTQALELVSKGYVDSVATGLTIQGAVRVATTAALTVTYLNGASGVGATLTNAGAQAALTIDGVALALTNRVLVKNQASTFQNGIYQVSIVGSGASNWVLTRTTDYDQASEINPGDLVIVNAGTANASSSWVETATVVTVGTDPIVFTQFSASLPISVANGGTGSTTAATARTNLGAAASGANADITSMTGLTGALRAPTFILDTNGNEQLGFTATAAAVNYIQFTNSITAIGPFITAAGSDPNIDLNLSGGGAGGIQLLTTNPTGPIVITNGTARQHVTNFIMPNTAATWSLTFPDANVVLPANPFITQIKTVLVSSSSTYTPTAGTQYVDVAGVGGGGGGGGAATTGGGQFAAGCGGGYGGYFFKTFTAAELGANAAVTIGAAGALGAAGNNAGGTGGDTIFDPAGSGGTLTANGGVGGAGQALQSGSNINNGAGAGGTATGGDLNMQGASGERGINLGINQALGGDGADGIWGRGAQGSINAAGATGPTVGFGSGGAGGASANSAQTAGSDGIIGLVIVTEYISV